MPPIVGLRCTSLVSIASISRDSAGEYVCGNGGKVPLKIRTTSPRILFASTFVLANFFDFEQTVLTRFVGVQSKMLASLAALGHVDVALTQPICT